MKFIQVAKEKLNLNDERIEKLREDICTIEDISNKYDLKFEDTFETSFVNHIFSCIDRIYEGEKVDFMGEEFMSELSEKALNISEEMLTKAYSKINEEIDKSEVCLLATHIELALNTQNLK